MGIVNVTPDSFSDGGLFQHPQDAVGHGARLVDEGADVVDVGGESTRPGSDPVPVEEELGRVLPVIEGILAARPGTPVSVDTRKAAVAKGALAAGASIVNDVSAGSDPEMFGVVRRTEAGMVLMHMKGDPKTMQVEPHYDDVVEEVREFLRERVEAAVFAGISAQRLCVDPGIGFGKDLGHNLELLRHLSAFEDLGATLMVGPSRKRFVRMLTGAEDPDALVEGTAAAVAWCAAQRVDVVRVHDVGQMVRVLKVVDAIVRGGA
ncbi:MAG: dihydropteroate synthase [Actinobacteria bacterium]|nr:dihydropteroate synthase [Actinomycetota bacterium]